MPELTLAAAEDRAEEAEPSAPASPAFTAAITWPAAALAALTPWFSEPAADERQPGAETPATCAASDCTLCAACTVYCFQLESEMFGEEMLPSR